MNTVEEVEETREKDAHRHRDLAAFSYFLVLAPLLLFSARKSEFVLFHARQATGLLLFGIFFAFLPSPFHYLNFIVAALALAGFIQANLEKKWRMPIVSHIIASGLSADGFFHIFAWLFRTTKKAFSSSSEKTENLVTDSSKTVEEKIASLEKEIVFLQNRVCALEDQKNCVERHRL